ncbi:hypothetical protein [Planomonospora sp. ID82291]|uniref:hypothetical protein n=1 Tax=Planomonospora sp. ID82291 TaxID=2738136 RepID=UPI0018C3BF2A|nr:hypothetical protein [Planomonospora sp. ID82291]MBG0818456.1 hypothetical protein [Planomonospora sp. ID82291]
MFDETTHPPTWQIAMPPGMRLLNANDRLHRMAEARIIKALREAAWVMFLASKIPTQERIYIQGVYCPLDGRRVAKRDPANWQPTYKALVDGLIAPNKDIARLQAAGRYRLGLLPDDNHTHLVGPDPRLGPVVTGGQIILRIWPLPALP